MRLSHVIVYKKPTDCQWEHALIGNKDCHYGKQVVLSKDGEGRVAMEYVTWEKTQD